MRGRFDQRPSNDQMQSSSCSGSAVTAGRVSQCAAEFAAWPLQHNADRDCFAGMHTVVEVIPVVISNIDVVGGIPILRPVSRPRVNHHESKTAVLEAGVTGNYIRLAVDAKPVSCAEMEIKTS